MHVAEAVSQAQCVRFFHCMKRSHGSEPKQQARKLAYVLDTFLVFRGILSRDKPLLLFP